MEATAREFSQHASQMLAAAERGERITVTKNGRPVAVLSPVTDEPVPPYPTNPMGEDEDAPVFDSGSAIDWAAGRGGYPEEFTTRTQCSHSTTAISGWCAR